MWIVDLPRYFGSGPETLLRWGSLALPSILALLGSRSRLPRRTPVSIISSVSAFIFILLVTILVTDVTGPGYVELARVILSIGVLAYVAKNFQDNTSANQLIKLLGDVLLTVCVLSLAAQYLDPLSVKAGRLRGITPHTNILGLACAIGVAVCCSDFSRKGKIFNIFQISLYVFTAFLTQSSTCELICISIIALRSLELFLIKIGVQRRSALTIVSNSAWIISVLSLFTPFAFMLLGRNAAINAFRYDPATLERYYAWRTSLDNFTAHPILGTGYGSGLALYETSQKEVTVLRYSHSVILTYLGTTGIVGCIALLSVVLFCMMTVSRAAKTNAPDTNGAARTAIFLLFSIVMFSSVEAGLQLMPVSWCVLWLAVGLALQKPLVEKKVRLVSSPFVTARPPPQTA